MNVYSSLLYPMIPEDTHGELIDWLSTATKKKVGWTLKYMEQGTDPAHSNDSVMTFDGAAEYILMSHGGEPKGLRLLFPKKQSILYGSEEFGFQQDRDAYLYISQTYYVRKKFEDTLQYLLGCGYTEQIFSGTNMRREYGSSLNR